MKKFFTITNIIVLLCLGVSVGVRAQQFNLFDINNSKDGNPSNYSLYDPNPQYDFLYRKFQYAVLNGIAYFTANDGIHGEELWRSDGTATGTYMVKDINPGSNSSGVRAITVSGNKIFFRADNGFNGLELWASDGTDAGTYMVKDISPWGSSSPSFLTDVNGTLYFFVDYSYVADQLWKSDGTDGGTVMVCDFLSQFGSGYASQLTSAGKHLYFTLNQQYDPELFTSDGTSGGTHLVKYINPFGSSNIKNLTAANGLLYFSAEDGSGRHLWITDGTDPGTYAANNPNNINVVDAGDVTFVASNGKVYFSGDNYDGNGSRLCTYATSGTGIVKAVKIINPGHNSYNLYNLTNVNGTIFFTVFDGTDQVLWKSDGTSAGTGLVKNINPGGLNIYLYEDFVNANGTLLFSYYDDASGYELWKSDGTDAGTVMVKEINPGPYSAQVADVTYVGNNISFFEATDGTRGLELWKTDGTNAGTEFVKNINTSTSGSSNVNSLIASPDNSKLLFVATDPKYGTELRITDGTQAGTRVVRDLIQGTFSSYPFLPVNYNDATFFFANIAVNSSSIDDLRTQVQLCATDGTAAGTRVLSLPTLEALINSNAYVVSMQASSNLLYMLIFNNTKYGYELWRSDGTDAGTYALKTGITPYYGVNMKAVGNLFYFSFYDYSYGNVLWVTDGTVGGTKMINSVTNSYYFLGNFASFNNKLYFSLDNGYGPFLWSSDGTDAGTTELKPGYIAYQPPVQSNGKLFFGGTKTVGVGNELYAIDGTNTYLVKDINPGPASSNISDLTGGDSLVYFTADDGTHGREIWKSNGTAIGTRLTKDISSGFGNTYPSNMITVHNELYFTLSDFILGDVLWQSDGTKNGTFQVNDLNLANVTNMSSFATFGNKLAFTGLASSTGDELYIGESAGSSIIADNQTSNLQAIQKTASFNVIVYPNPVMSNAMLQISGEIKSVQVSIADMSGKILWQNHYSGQAKISLPVEKLTPGTYIVTVRNSSEIQSVKFVKQ
jgi:ELWxxDGT repeat protein